MLLWELEKFISLLCGIFFICIMKRYLQGIYKHHLQGICLTWLSISTLTSCDSQPRYQQLLLCFYFCFPTSQRLRFPAGPGSLILITCQSCQSPRGRQAILSHLSQIASWPLLKPLALPPSISPFHHWSLKAIFFLCEMLPDTPVPRALSCLGMAHQTL